MAYVAGFAALYYGALLGFLVRYRGKAFLVLSLLFLAAIAIFRGDVGTDTAAYERIAGRARDDWLFGRFEPGFVVLVHALTTLFSSDVVVVRLITVVYVALLGVFIARADRDEAFMFFFFIVPAFFYNYSMNGLRIGLASAFLLLAAQQARRHSEKDCAALCFTALLFHYTSALSFLFIWAAGRRWMTGKGLLFAGGMVVFVSFFLLLNLGYLADKFGSYVNRPPPSSFSGLSKVALIGVLMLGVVLSRLPEMEKIKVLLLSVGSCILLMGVTSYSYAGLRLLDLLAFVVPMMILVVFGRARVALDPRMKTCIVAAGLLAALAIYRNFLGTAGLGPTPFLPYSLVF